MEDYKMSIIIDSNLLGKLSKKIKIVIWLNNGQRAKVK